LEIDPEEFKRHYADLSDEGLLSIDRMDLIQLAQNYYDAEVASRGLHRAELATPVEAGPEEDLVLAAKFQSVEEANLGRALLRDADIPAYLENELTSAWTGAGGLRLMVPGSLLEQAQRDSGRADLGRRFSRPGRGDGAGRRRRRPGVNVSVARAVSYGLRLKSSSLSELFDPIQPATY
jgi:hypothetical protein